MYLDCCQSTRKYLNIYDYLKFKNENSSHLLLVDGLVSGFGDIPGLEYNWGEIQGSYFHNNFIKEYA